MREVLKNIDQKIKEARAQAQATSEPERLSCSEVLKDLSLLETYCLALPECEERKKILEGVRKWISNLSGSEIEYLEVESIRRLEIDEEVWEGLLNVIEIKSEKAEKPTDVEKS